MFCYLQTHNTFRSTPTFRLDTQHEFQVSPRNLQRAQQKGVGGACKIRTGICLAGARVGKSFDLRAVFVLIMHACMHKQGKCPVMSPLYS